MVTRFSLLALMLAATAAAGCKSPYHSDQLAGTGAVVGGMAGAALSKSHPLAGAATGAIIGAVTGEVVGEAMDESEARNQALFQARLGRQMTGTVSHHDIIAMSQAGLGDQVIITHIRNHGVVQTPSAADLVALKQSGVSDPVLAAMQMPPPASGPPVVYGPGPQPVVVREYWGPPRYYRDPWYGPPCHGGPGPRVGWGVSVWR